MERSRGRETVIRIYYVRKESIFTKKNKRETHANWLWMVAQLAEFLLNMHKPWIPSPAPDNIAHKVQAYNPSNWQVESGGSGVQRSSWAI